MRQNGDLCGKLPFFRLFCLKISVIRLPSAAVIANYDSCCDFGKTNRGSKECKLRGAFFFIQNEPRHAVPLIASLLYNRIRKLQKCAWTTRFRKTGELGEGPLAFFWRRGARIKTLRSPIFDFRILANFRGKKRFFGPKKGQNRPKIEVFLS